MQIFDVKIGETYLSVVYTISSPDRLEAFAEIIEALVYKASDHRITVDPDELYHLVSQAVQPKNAAIRNIVFELICQYSTGQIVVNYMGKASRKFDLRASQGMLSVGR